MDNLLLVIISVAFISLMYVKFGKNFGISFMVNQIKDEFYLVEDEVVKYIYAKLPANFKDRFQKEEIRVLIRTLFDLLDEIIVEIILPKAKKYKK